jgi:hypothetical protein
MPREGGRHARRIGRLGPDCSLLSVNAEMCRGEVEAATISSPDPVTTEVERTAPVERKEELVPGGNPARECENEDFLMIEALGL